MNKMKKCANQNLLKHILLCARFEFWNLLHSSGNHICNLIKSIDNYKNNKHFKLI